MSSTVWIISHFLLSVLPILVHSQPLDPRSTTTAKTLDPPEGWSNDPDHMDYDYFWRDRGDLKAVLERRYGLTDAQPLCAKLPDSGEITFLFQSGSQYYVYNDISQVTCSIEKPQRLEDIYAVISKFNGALRGLEMNQL